MFSSSRYQPMPCTFFKRPGCGEPLWSRRSSGSPAQEKRDKQAARGYLVGAATLLADVEGDAVCQLLGAQQVYIVRDEEGPGPCHCGPPPGDKGWGPKIRSPLGFCELGREESAWVLVGSMSCPPGGGSSLPVWCLPSAPQCPSAPKAVHQLLSPGQNAHVKGVKSRYKKATFIFLFATVSLQIFLLFLFSEKLPKAKSRIVSLVARGDTSLRSSSMFWLLVSQRGQSEFLKRIPSPPMLQPQLSHWGLSSPWTFLSRWGAPHTQVCEQSRGGARALLPVL